MKNPIKLLVVLLLLINGTTTFAKKVKFSVNMKGQTISANGIHISGNFQTLAGYPGGDWQSNTTPLSRETADTNIYSVVVDIPANRAYQYKFVNGDLFYEVEFVPEESRVGFDFIDNRWVYIDSLATDTTLVGPFLFGGNAPENKKLIRLKVDLRNVTAAANGIHVAGNFQNWSYNSHTMYSFSGTTYEFQAYVDSNTTVEYKFVNGTQLSEAEIVPSSCANPAGNRQMVVTADVVIDSICYATCAICEITSGVTEYVTKNKARLFPNPSNYNPTLHTGNAGSSVFIFGITGNLIQSYNHLVSESIELDQSQLKTGMYFIEIVGPNAQVQKIKWLVE